MCAPSDNTDLADAKTLVQQDHDSGKYRLGLAMVRLGGHAEKTLDLRTLALPELASLARAVKETD